MGPAIGRTAGASETGAATGCTVGTKRSAGCMVPGAVVVLGVGATKGCEIGGGGMREGGGVVRTTGVSVVQISRKPAKVIPE